MANRMQLPESVTNVDVAVYATAVLGGSEKKIHSEHIAARCFNLDPSRFGWRLSEYRGWPDKYIVRTALEDAKKEEHGYLVDGVYNLDPAKDGWRLTHKGAVWFRDNCSRLEKHFGTPPAGKTAAAKDQLRLLRHLKEQPLYHRFGRERTLSDVSQYAFTDMLNCSPDATSDVIALKFRRFLASAELAGENDALVFLNACAEKFGSLMPGWERKEKH